MYLSSTSSSSVAKRGWGIFTWPVYLVLIMALAEIALRVPALTNHLPQPETFLWHATNVQAKVDRLTEAAAGPGVDVLFVGNSTVLAGMDPRAFDRARGADHGPMAFNGALEGLPADSVLTFVRVYANHVQPRTIIYGLTPQDLNDNSAFVNTVTEDVQQAPLVMAETDASWRGRLMAGALEHSQLFRYRQVLHRWLLSGGTLTPPTIYFDDRGFGSSGERLSDVAEASRAKYYNRAGVTNYSAQGRQVAALRELMAYCQAQHIQLIVANMPLATDYFGNFDKPADYQTYLATVRAATADYGVPFWDMQAQTQSSGFNDASFADFNHLNRNGAARLSALLADGYAAYESTVAQSSKSDRP